MCCVSIQNSLKKRKTKQQKNPKPQTAFQNKTLPQVGFFFFYTEGISAMSWNLLVGGCYVSTAGKKFRCCVAKATVQSSD